MAERAQLMTIVGLLEGRYGELGSIAGRNLEAWLSGKVRFADEEMIGLHLAEEHVDLVFDAFWQVLPFGTGGRRGRVGYGPNRVNLATIALTVQGHCNLLRSAHGDDAELAVVVANDVRQFRDMAGAYRFLPGDHPLLGVSARSLARLACEIYAGNGIRAWFREPAAEMAFMTTPELSFLIAELGAAGGVNLSASHNPPDDNGIKIYDETGSQPVAPHDQRLVDVMEEVSEIRQTRFETADAQGLVRDISGDMHGRYLETYVSMYGDAARPDSECPIVYTPLSGCGLTSAGEVLELLQFPVQVPPDQGPDGAFAAIPFRSPNPEVVQATEPARDFAEKVGSGIVLSSDPDADRVGLEARLDGGSWYHFDGQQIAAVLCYFLMLDPEGPKRRGLVIETLVTTKLLGRIVEVAGDSFIVDDLLVGFKYIADVLSTLDRKGEYHGIRCSPSDLVLAAEESHGVMMAPSIRDKDSTPACMYLAGLHQRLAREGRNLVDYYAAILEEFGGYSESSRSIMLSGASGVAKRDRLMRALRSSPPETLGGQTVERIVDYWDQERFGSFVSESDKLPRNVLQFFTRRAVVTVRPSGTEPKAKFYCQLLPGDESPRSRGRDLLAEVRQQADELASRVYSDLLALLDLSLSPEALLLTDIIDLDRKATFDRRTVPELRTAIERGDRSFEDLLGWLRQEADDLVPGADGLPALRAPLARLAERWSHDIDSPLLEDLRRWARG